ncbi:MAG: methylmalonyl Co-A mutase-associated GTPase MeaB [bacterium]|nr:methylmalonyl Co-A mutase-associated GTPase MeaB [bacterium]
MSEPQGAAVDVGRFADGVVAGDRAAVARAITLVESTRADHQQAADELVSRLLPRTGHAHRIGITGVPGAGKSTFVEALGTRLTAQGRRVAVLAVDPSSVRSGGSILGDKTRMARLSTDPAAYVRPSPSAGSLGGVTRSTRQAIVIVEAAGYDVVVVETVGVGQSEVAVAEMVDTFLLLMLTRTGDSLQGIKRGVLELADVIAVNKADGKHVADAQRAAQELASAIHLLAPKSLHWRVPVLTCSARDGMGIDEVWARVQGHRACIEAKGELEAMRLRQETQWMWSLVHDRVLRRLRESPAVREHARRLEGELRARGMTASRAAAELLARLGWWDGEG